MYIPKCISRIIHVHLFQVFCLFNCIGKTKTREVSKLQIYTFRVKKSIANESELVASGKSVNDTMKKLVLLKLLLAKNI